LLNNNRLLLKNRIGNGKSPSDDVCFGLGWDNLSGWLILDPH